jgi:TonB family protein
MIAQAREALRRKPLVGVAVSVAIHAALLAVLLFVHPAGTPSQKRGDALIVELPSEESGRGTPGPQANAPATPDLPAPSPKAPTLPPAAPARPQAPAPARPPAAARAKPAPKAEPRETPRAVASAPQPPPAAQSGDIPAAKSARQAPSEAAAPEAAKPEAPQPEASKPEAPAPAAPPATASAPPSPPGPVAMIPPGPVDSRAALRRGGGGGGIGQGGAGGFGGGRGGIEGEPIPLNSSDPDFSDYLERVRALIKRYWVSPCVKDSQTHICEYKSGFLIIEFGILKSGQLAFLELQRSSGYVVLDDSAANAIKLASPFPAIPPALLKGRKGPGVPIVARFHYVLETDFRSVIR